MDTRKGVSLDFRTEEQTETSQIRNRPPVGIEIESFSVQEQHPVKNGETRAVKDGSSRKTRATQRFEINMTVHEPLNSSIKSNQDNLTKRKGLDSSEKVEDESVNNTCHEPEQILEAHQTTSTSVAFLIPLNQTKVCRPPPKRFCKPQKKADRENLSMERIQVKQKMAEQRKKQHEQWRLKRIYDRQEAARKLANNVEILLYQKSLTAVERNNKPHTHKMECAELLATARCVARDFKTLTCQMSKDFAINDRNNNVAQKYHAAGKQVKMRHPQKEQHSKAPISQQNNNENNRYNTINKNNSSKSIAFTVGFDDESHLKSPAPKVLEAQKRKGQHKPTAVELQEKQRLAEERRAKRREERVQKVVANREALLKLASDLETFMIWNDKEQSGSTDNNSNINDKVLDQREVAKIAKEIANGFDRISQRYTRDLQRAEGFSALQLLESGATVKGEKML